MKLLSPAKCGIDRERAFFLPIPNLIKESSVKRRSTCNPPVLPPLLPASSYHLAPIHHHSVLQLDARLLGALRGPIAKLTRLQMTAV